MNHVTLYLCENLENCKFATRHSDEISLLLYDGEKEETQPTFGNSVNKIISLAAAMATGELVLELIDAGYSFYEIKTPCLDARGFNIPEEDVLRYFVSRKIDAERNNISAWARSKFSHSQVNGKNGSEKKEMLLQEGINFDDLPNEQKYGFQFVRKDVIRNEVLRKSWHVEPIPERFEEEFFENFLNPNKGERE